MWYPVHVLNSVEKRTNETLHLTHGGVVVIMWGVTACWVVASLLTPVFSGRPIVAICVAMFLLSLTCCIHIGWVVQRQIKALRIENSPKLDALLGIATAFAAGRIVERQLQEDRDDIKNRVLGNVIYLDQERLRRPVPPTPPEDWEPEESNGFS